MGCGSGGDGGGGGARCNSVLKESAITATLDVNIQSHATPPPASPTHFRLHVARSCWASWTCESSQPTHASTTTTTTASSGKHNKDDIPTESRTPSKHTKQRSSTKHQAIRAHCLPPIPAIHSHIGRANYANEVPLVLRPLELPSTAIVGDVDVAEAADRADVLCRPRGTFPLARPPAPSPPPPPPASSGASAAVSSSASGERFFPRSCDVLSLSPFPLPPPPPERDAGPAAPFSASAVAPLPPFPFPFLLLPPLAPASLPCFWALPLSAALLVFNALLSASTASLATATAPELRPRSEPLALLSPLILIPPLFFTATFPLSNRCAVLPLWRASFSGSPLSSPSFASKPAVVPLPPLPLGCLDVALENFP